MASIILRAKLGLIKKAAKVYLSQYEGVYDMAIPEPFQSDSAKLAEDALREILTGGGEVLVFNGFCRRGCLESLASGEPFITGDLVVFGPEGKKYWQDQEGDAVVPITIVARKDG